MKGMIAKQLRPETGVDDYLAAVPDEARAALEKLRRDIRSAAPAAEERIGWRMPMFHHLGPLVAFAAFRSHLSFFVMSPAVIKAHRVELKRYDTAAGTVRFPADKPLPSTLVRKLVRARVRENEALHAGRARK
ncbi:MAG: DUF1801 domain-containing protein [bacterium]